MADENNNTTIIIKKIKKAGHGHHGGAWKVAYADFVTAMMAFFLVMWIVAMSDKTKKGIQNYFNDPLKYLTGSDKFFVGMFETNRGKEPIADSQNGGVSNSKRAGGLSRMHLIAKDIQGSVLPFKEEVFDFKVHPDRIQFAITAEALFSPGSALLKPESQGLLKRIADVLKPLGASIMVEGHTDDLPVDSATINTNWELSVLRASTVVRYLIEGFYFDPTKLTPMGAGEYRPIADNRTPEGRAKNRRIDIYIIPDQTDRLRFRSTSSEGTPVKAGE